MKIENKCIRHTWRDGKCVRCGKKPKRDRVSYYVIYYKYYPISCTNLKDNDIVKYKTYKEVLDWEETNSKIDFVKMYSIYAIKYSGQYLLKEVTL